ncbi:DDE-type integrase/transposase/recombinase [Nocardiopsis dassonvillei]|uniref:DDE-type integrase/transposase/recombinase n=1 Tax=Nocardiopsis dassonvillei TaxID=2014 RepID=UPI0036FC0405
MFTADVPNRLWTADITYIHTFTGWVYTAFVINVITHRALGWQVSQSLHTDLTLDVLEMTV